MNGILFQVGLEMVDPLLTILASKNGHLSVAVIFEDSIALFPDLLNIFSLVC